MACIRWLIRRRVDSRPDRRPQAWRIVKTRKTAWPIVVENAVCALAGFILMMKLLPHHLRHAVADRIDPES